MNAFAVYEKYEEDHYDLLGLFASVELAREYRDRELKSLEAEEPQRKHCLQIYSYPIYETLEQADQDDCLWSCIE